MVRSVVATLQQSRTRNRARSRSRTGSSHIHQSLSKTVSLNDKLVTLNASLDTHLSKHTHNRLSPVALLVRKTSHACHAARTLTKSSQNRNNREEIRTVGSVYSKRLERSSLHCNITFVAIQLRKARTCIHEDIHDRKVSLKRSCIKPANTKLSKNGTGYKEISRSTPVTFEIYICCLIFLTSLHLEDYLRTKRPVTARLDEIPAAKHIVTHLDTELLQHLKSYEHIWNALWLTDYQRSILLRERQSHKQS